MKKFALSIIVDSRFARINQFDVSARLAGLEEKFRILNNDELADALHSRLVELQSKTYRWEPEALSLLLQLSDQPLQNSKVEHLEKLRPVPILPPLTWADIIADDPLENQTGIWDDVDYAADSSDEDNEVVFGASESSDSTPDLTEENKDLSFNSDLFLLPINPDASEQITKSQFWRKIQGFGERSNEHDASIGNSESMSLTEAQLSREIIFMLLGLPTPIYRYGSDGRLTQDLSPNITHLSQESVGHVLDAFARLGDDLNKIRAWCRRSEELPVHQIFQAGLESKMSEVDSALTKIETTILNFSSSSIISVLGLLDEVSRMTNFTQQLAAIVAELSLTPKIKMPFKILEVLCDWTSRNQCIGDVENYKNMASLFFDCLRIYLKPVRRWMESGEIGSQERDFFVKRIPEEVSLESLWQEQHFLIHDNIGSLYAPNFFHMCVRKIFTTGKSVDFLKKLGYDVENQATEERADQHLNFENFYDSNNFDKVSPFSELLGVALERWITSTYHSSSQILLQSLKSQCDLEQSLDALELVYFFRNGALSYDIAITIFDRINNGVKSWNDSFLLTELFQRAFSTVSFVDAIRLAVRISTVSLQESNKGARRSELLCSLQVWYTLPWPIANIVNRSSIQTHQRIYVFLLQINRVKYLFERQRLLIGATVVSKKENGEDQQVYSLRHRFLWFTNSLLAYLTGDVISTETAKMRFEIAETEDMDSMIEIHKNFVSQLENQCLLSKKLVSTHDAIISLLDVGINFSDIHASFIKQSTSNPAKCFEFSAKRRERPVKSNEGDEIVSDWSDDDTRHENGDGKHQRSISFEETHFTARLEEMHKSFREMLSVVVSGLYEIHRAERNSCFETLADNLAAGLEK